MLFVALEQDYFPRGILKDKYNKKLNYPMLFYRHPQKDSIIEIFSYYQTTSWEVLQKS